MGAAAARIAWVLAYLCQGRKVFFLTRWRNAAAQVRERRPVPQVRACPAYPADIYIPADLTHMRTRRSHTCARRLHTRVLGAYSARVVAQGQRRREDQVGAPAAPWRGHRPGHEDGSTVVACGRRGERPRQPVRRFAVDFVPGSPHVLSVSSKPRPLSSYQYSGTCLPTLSSQVHGSHVGREVSPHGKISTTPITHETELAVVAHSGDSHRESWQWGWQWGLTP